MFIRQLQRSVFTRGVVFNPVRSLALKTLPTINTVSPPRRFLSSFTDPEAKTSPYDRQIDDIDESQSNTFDENSNDASPSAFDDMGYTTGTVKWFDSSKGFGFIIRHDTNEDIFVHFTAIQGSGYRTLEEGQRVQFSVQEGHKGPVAEDVTIEMSEF